MTPDQVEMFRKAKADWRRKLSRARVKARSAAPDDKLAAVSHFTSLLSSEERPRELLLLIAHDPPEVFWPIFLTEWSGCDNGWQWQQVIPAMMRRVGPCPVEVYERHAQDCGEFFDSLPEQLTVYRGGDRSRIAGGISWTTDRKIALSFAWGHRGFRSPKPMIATATIAKADIFAAVSDRGEKEIICLPKVEKIEAIDNQ